MDVLGESVQDSIGTRNETTVHSFLKSHIDPDTSHHEVRIGSYIADVANETGIYEIQSRSFYRIRAKLEALLKISPVTLIYPAAARKTLYWINPETGDCSAGRKSSKSCSICEIWRELPDVADLLENEAFSVRFVLAEMEEYRMLDGFGEQKKYRATHVDRQVCQIKSEIIIHSPEELIQLFPEKLCGTEFDSQEFAKAGRIPRKAAQKALAVLNRYGIVTRVSHNRSGYRYRLTKTDAGDESEYKGEKT